MIHIVGSTYLEKCLEPPWEELFGSGVRAVIALASLEDKISFTSYVGEKEEDTLDRLASDFNFSLEKKIIPYTVSFDYHHCLSEPLIHPSVPLIKKNPPLTVKDDLILRFGFLEGDAVVDGEKVVYDPQDAYNPKLFRENGSTAKELAIITNTSECRKLVENFNPNTTAEELGKSLLEKDSADIVVIKRGSLGALVVTRTESHNIPAYRTSRVWSIGSGDVFVAVFAHFWGTGGKSPLEAASLASLATAYYCDRRRLPIPLEFQEKATYSPIIRNNDFPYKSKKVYLAGPFFTMAERWIIEQARKFLFEQGFKVFSPLHDVGYGDAEQVAPADIKGLEECDLVFAVLDGLDAGTLFEIGYAKSLNKPVIVFVQNESEEDLKMISGTGCEIVNDFVSAIYRTTWAAMQITD